jgi:hypothetical protein
MAEKKTFHIKIRFFQKRILCLSLFLFQYGFVLKLGGVRKVSKPLIFRCLSHSISFPFYSLPFSMSLNNLIPGHSKCDPLHDLIPLISWMP